MATPTTIRVLAANDRGIFIGHDSVQAEYCIFELGDTREILAGNRLSGDFHGHSASTFTANNLTTGDSPRIDLHDWELSLTLAVERFMSIHSATKIFVGQKIIMAHSDNVVLHLMEEIGRS